MERLFQVMQRLVEQASMSFIRNASHEIEWRDRMLGLVGPRGIGKTTLFLQRIKARHSLEDTLYASADNMYFNEHTLYDTAETFMLNGGKHFFIDEVHKYENWSQELKMMYDDLPDLHVYFTGSSILDIEKGKSDLSRRAPIYEMQGLSFREYLSLTLGIELASYDLEQILAHEYSLPEVDRPLKHFKEYLKTGYYPFGSDFTFEAKLDQIISQTLEVDIPQFSGMTFATGRKLKKLMSIIAIQAPFKPNMVKLSSQIGANRNAMDNYLAYMEKAGMIILLHNAGGLGTLGKLEKVYLDNTNALYNLSESEPNIGTVRETFFLNQMRVNYSVTSSEVADFQIDDITFEIGGKGKTGKQLKSASNGIIVRDDIEYGHGNIVPLWAFGLTY